MQGRQLGTEAPGFSSNGGACDSVRMATSGLRAALNLELAGVKGKVVCHLSPCACAASLSERRNYSAMARRGWASNDAAGNDVCRARVAVPRFGIGRTSASCGFGSLGLDLGDETRGDGRDRVI